MALSAFLTLKGVKQGAIQGPVMEKGKEGTILVHGFENAIVSPRDPATGQATGRREHEPVVIIKEIDKSSPKLWAALVTNEVLDQWVLNVWGSALIPGPGAEKNIYRIELTNASVVSIDETMADDSVEANAGLPLHEQVTFVYQRITWTWIDGAVTASDDWSG